MESLMYLVEKIRVIQAEMIAKKKYLKEKIAE